MYIAKENLNWSGIVKTRWNKDIINTLKARHHTLNLSIEIQDRVWGWW